MQHPNEVLRGVVSLCYDYKEARQKCMVEKLQTTIWLPPKLGVLKVERRRNNFSRTKQSWCWLYFKWWEGTSFDGINEVGKSIGATLWKLSYWLFLEDYNYAYCLVYILWWLRVTRYSLFKPSLTRRILVYNMVIWFEKYKVWSIGWCTVRFNMSVDWAIL